MKTALGLTVLVLALVVTFYAIERALLRRHLAAIECDAGPATDTNMTVAWSPGNVSFDACSNGHGDECSVPFLSADGVCTRYKRPSNTSCIGECMAPNTTMAHCDTVTGKCVHHEIWKYQGYCVGVLISYTERNGTTADPMYPGMYMTCDDVLDTTRVDLNCVETQTHDISGWLMSQYFENIFNMTWQGYFNNSVQNPVYLAKICAWSFKMPMLFNSGMVYPSEAPTTSTAPPLSVFPFTVNDAARLFNVPLSEGRYMREQLHYWMQQFAQSQGGQQLAGILQTAVARR